MTGSIVGEVTGFVGVIGGDVPSRGVVRSVVVVRGVSVVGPARDSVGVDEPPVGVCFIETVLVSGRSGESTTASVVVGVSTRSWFSLSDNLFPSGC